MRSTNENEKRRSVYRILSVLGEGRCGPLAVVAAVLLLGSVAASAQLPATIDLNVTPGTEASPVTRIYGDDANDYMGSDRSKGIAFGDVNGDGFDDVIIGAFHADPPGGSNAGEVYVIYGSAALPATSLDLNSAEGSNGETRILGRYTGDCAGESVACGDVNGDGYDDVIVGAPFGDPDGRTDAGEVYVIYGGAALSGTTIDLSTTPGTNGETRILGDDFDDRAGNSVSSADINGDGYDDVVIGVPYADVTAGSDGGEVYIVYGGVGLPGVQVNLSYAPGTNGETRILGGVGGASVGWAVANGDVNGDGYFDVVFGAPNADPGGINNAGTTFVVYGGAGLPATVLDLADPAGTHGETWVLGDDAGDLSGYSVAAGDVDGDGYDDVVIGAYRGGPSGRTDAGEAYVIYGGATLSGVIVNLDSAIGSNAETRILGDDGGDYAGWCVAAGDVNGDGLDDVIVGARYADEPGGTDAGEVEVIYGNAGLPGTTVDLSSASPNVTVLGDNASDYFAHSTEAKADVNRNGFSDFAAAAAYGDNPSVSTGDNRTGYTVVVYGDGAAAGAAVTEYFKVNAAPKRGIGGALSPVVRTWLSFDAGTMAPVTVTLTRSDAGISGLGDGWLSDVADVVWLIATTRTGFNAAQVTFQYLDSEITGLPENGLALFQAPALSGPWTEVSGQGNDLDKNEISGTVTGFSPTFFALKTDNTPPVVGTVGSDAGPYTENNAALGFSWPGFADAESGIVDYEVALGTSGDPEAFAPFTSVGIMAGHTFAAGPYADGAYICTVRATNGVGLSSEASGQVIVDTTLPVAGVVTSDAGDYTTDNTQVAFAWTAFTDAESDIADYEVAFGDGSDPEAYQGFMSVGLANTATLTGSPLADGLYVCTVRGINGAGGATEADAQVTLDTTPPDVGTVTSDTGDYTSSTTALIFSWTGFADLGSGITGYEVALGDSGDPEAFVAFTSVGIVATHTFNGTFTNGATYLCTVRATNGAGLTASGSGNVTIDADPPTVLSIVLDDPATINMATVHFTVTFSEPVTGVNLATPFNDFALTLGAKAITGAQITGVAGADDVYTVSVAIGSGDGSIRLDVLAAGGIQDVAASPLAGNYTAGPSYTIVHLAFVSTPPTELNLKADESYTFAVEVTGGTPPYNYAWYKDLSTTPIATSPLFQIPVLQVADTGTYYCVVTDAYETVTTNPVDLEVRPSQPAAGNLGLALMSVLCGMAGVVALRVRRAKQS